MYLLQNISQKSQILNLLFHNFLISWHLKGTCVRDRPELSSCSRAYTNGHRGESCQGALYVFLNVIFDAFRFGYEKVEWEGNSILSKYNALLVETATRSQQSYCVYAFDNVDKYGRPLNVQTLYMFWLFDEEVNIVFCNDI